MSILQNPINYGDLEQELREALRADELYKLQNDAKIRAIEQAVPTYNEFREIVNGAHLKSLDRKDMTPKIGVKWNSVAGDKTSRCAEKILSSDRLQAKQISLGAIPRNAHEFRQAWRSIVDYREKFELLHNSRLSLRGVIFRSEFPPDILHDCICACLEALKSPEKSSAVVDVLSSLSECNRFRLAVAFMSEQEKMVCRKLFESLRNADCAPNVNLDAVNVLEKSYVP